MAIIHYTQDVVTDSQTMEFVQRASVVNLKRRERNSGDGSEKRIIMVEVGVNDIEKHTNSSRSGVGRKFHHNPYQKTRISTQWIPIKNKALNLLGAGLGA